MSKGKNVPMVSISINAFDTFNLQIDCSSEEDFDLAILALKKYREQQRMLAKGRIDHLTKVIDAIDE